ncbi:MAG: hypothetical protein ABEJ30_05605 [Halorientalis sp.]
MTSLTDVYERGVGLVATRERVYAGLALFAVGAVMVVVAIVLATTGLGEALGLGTFGARELAGVLAGLGVPAAVLGSFAVLPASERARAAAVIGGSLSLLGVALFRAVYPRHWVGSPAALDLTLPVAVVYLAGTIATFWCLFVAVANFETRTDPGGTVRMEVTEAGTTRVLEVTGSVPGFGSVGLFGNDPDGEVATQTNREATLYEADPTPGGPAASDGGATTQEADAPAGETPDAVEQVATPRGQPDPYCGNCEQFQYVRVDGEMRPACTLHKEIMDDMDACDDWQANS